MAGGYLMLRLITGDTDGTQPCVIATGHEPEPVRRSNHGRHKAVRSRIEAEVRAECTATAFQQAVDYVATGLTPQFVAALRENGAGAKVTIGDTAVRITLSGSDSGVTDPDQVQEIWAAVVQTFGSINELPYLRSHVRPDLPDEVVSLEWSTSQGPVVVVHAAVGPRQCRRRLSKWLSGHGPASLIPILGGIGVPKIAGVIAACVGMCVVADVSGNPVTSVPLGDDRPALIRIVHVPPVLPTVTPSGRPLLKVAVSSTPGRPADLTGATGGPSPRPDSSPTAAPSTIPDTSPTRAPVVVPPAAPDVTPPLPATTPPAIDVAPSVVPTALDPGIPTPSQ
ncbi:MAG: hypothetical protein JWN52_6629 [Actinomycetia bacterium]|nr:hypothetical protein [Actinomycetes bacterium]